MSALSDYIGVAGAGQSCGGNATLVGYWPLNETTGTVATELNGLAGNGTYTGSVPGQSYLLNVGGPPYPNSNAARFNYGQSDGYLDLGANAISPHLNGTGNIVLGGLYKLPLEWTYQGDEGIIGTLLSDSKLGFRLILYPENTLRADGVSADADTMKIVNYTNPEVVALNKWHMAMAHFDLAGDKIYLYHNGVCVNPGGTDAAFSSNTFVAGTPVAAKDGIACAGYYSGAIQSLYRGNICNVFVLHTASNVDTIAANIWSKMQEGFNRQMLRARPANNGHYSVRHLQL